MKRNRLSRRTFLRGAGTLIGLPMLEAMLPAGAFAQDTPASPRRLLSFYVPNGIVMERWTPTRSGEDFDLPPILTPLVDLKSDITVISGLKNDPARPDGPGDHAAGTGSFLTSAHVFKTEGRDIRNGISMDQVAANAIGDQTTFRSLQLGSEGGRSTGGCDSGYSCAYARNISWAGPATPLPKEVSAQAAFDRLFGDLDPLETREAARKRRLYRQSVLDFVSDDATRLQRKLGTTDRLKIDEYLTSVRELERRIQNVDNEPVLCEAGARPGSERDIQTQARAMADIMVVAMQCDLTRVITYMLGNAGSNRIYSFLGIGEGHHQVSHHQNQQNNLDRLETIDIWEMEQLAYLLSRMKAVQEPDGTLLDNSLVFFSSEVSDGNRHSHADLPVILAGRGGGAITAGRHLSLEGEPPIANLFISMLATVGVNVSTFGDDGTGPLAGLT